MTLGQPNVSLLVCWENKMEGKDNYGIALRVPWMKGMIDVYK